jgi:hypothetical protein
LIAGLFMLNLQTPTGLVFDLPHSTWMAAVLKLRANFDPLRLGFPIEITVVGSSGLGWFSPENDARAVLSVVQGIAAATAPFSFAFESVKRFPDSNVYYLAPDDASAFHAFQRELAQSGLRYEKTPFEYVPHCTIAILSHDAGEDAHRHTAACAVPPDRIRISSVSFYAVDFARSVCQQWDRVPLGG